MYDTNQLNGEQLLKLAQATFETRQVTPEQLSYVMDMLNPSTYMLRHHQIKGKPLTFNVSNHDYSRALGHRPWQVDLLDDKHRNFAVMKSRQLGLSEVGLGKLVHFVDTETTNNVKALYTFPTLDQVKDFVKTRVNPLFSRGYYSTIIDEDLDSLQVKKIRDSFIFFRTSSKPSAVEGVDIDYLCLKAFEALYGNI